jgi:hypothetical protein
MGKYVFAYRGGGGHPETPEEGEKVMAAWMSWFGTLGAAVLDGGNPFGPSMSVASSGAASNGGTAGLSGYSVVSAATLAAATDMATGCPVLSSGGTVDVYEAMDI